MTRCQRVVFSGLIGVGARANRGPNRRYPYPSQSAWESALDIPGQGHPKSVGPIRGGPPMLVRPGFTEARPYLIDAL
jgi:hypothetical protein